MTRNYAALFGKSMKTTGFFFIFWMVNELNDWKEQEAEHTHSLDDSFFPARPKYNASTDVPTRFVKPWSRWTDRFEDDKVLASRMTKIWVERWWGVDVELLIPSKEKLTADMTSKWRWDCTFCISSVLYVMFDARFKETINCKIRGQWTLWFWNIPVKIVTKW